MDFKKYKRKGSAEARPFDPETESVASLAYARVSISAEDLSNGSPKKGDMIARNPDNHNDQWLIAKEYFEKNFEV